MEWMGFDICGWGESASGTIHWTYCKWKNLKKLLFNAIEAAGW